MIVTGCEVLLQPTDTCVYMHKSRSRRGDGGGGLDECDFLLWVFSCFMVVSGLNSCSLLLLILCRVLEPQYEDVLKE